MENLTRTIVSAMQNMKNPKGGDPQGEGVLKVAKVEL
jgi:hypothetical protein